MNKLEIINAVNEGKIVCWKNVGYNVQKEFGEYWIMFTDGFKSPLINSKGNLIDKEKDFYILEITK